MARKLLKKNTKVQKVVKKVTPVATTHSKGAQNTAAAAKLALPQGEYTEAVGRRKVATARARIYKQAGDFIVNGKAAGQYFAGIANAPALYQEPFALTDTRNQFAVSITVSGSGLRSQLGAVRHALARALDKFDSNNHVPLKQAGLLTRDDRQKETRKIGMGGKARRQRQSPKR